MSKNMWRDETGVHIAPWGRNALSRCFCWVEWRRRVPCDRFTSVYRSVNRGLKFITGNLVWTVAESLEKELSGEISETLKCCVWTSFSWDLNQFHCIMFGISLCHLHLHNNLQVVREFCTYCLALTLEFLGSSLCWVAQRLSSFYGWGSWSSVKCTHMEGSRAAAWRMWGCHGVSTWSSEVLLRALCGHQVRTIYFLSVAHQVRTMYLFSVWLTKYTLSVYFLGVCSLCSLYVLWFLCGIMQLKI